ncbi:MAG: type II toxin-antitoxin system HigB family toxin [Thaumarchaeota archaeon]|nr:type II toxin-antitoxin system HigB family toxin [Nitrososphaerota archaeon]
MELLGKEKLQDFKEKHADAKSQIESWEAEIEEAQWDTPHNLKSRYPKASLLGNQQVVFNIRGDYYRLLVKVNYKNKIVLVKRIGTHKEYDKWKID